MTTAAERTTIRSPSPPSAPRLVLATPPERPAGPTLLDGGWWPRSADPAAELPGLILAIDALCGPIVHIMLGRAEWDSHPRRLGMRDRTIRLGWFTSQPAGLLTASTGNDKRVDLLVVPPGTPTAAANTAMATAADPGNTVRTPGILVTIPTAIPAIPRTAMADTAAEGRWETEGGRGTPDLG